MNCPGCRRDNDPRRRYCGCCGYNFQPVCRRCSFSNDKDDRFCGGCGALLIAAEGCSVPRAASPKLDPTALPFGSADRRPQVPAIEPVSAKRVPPPIPGVAHVPAPVRAVEVATGAAAELSDLFDTPAVRVEAPKLPEVGINQDDLDRLFGVAQ